MKKKVVIIISVLVFLVLLVDLLIGISINNKNKIMNDNMIVIQKEYDNLLPAKSEKISDDAFLATAKKLLLS